MAAEVVVVLLFLSIMGICVAVLLWDIGRRRLDLDSHRQNLADYQLRVSELEQENRRLKDQIEFLEKLAKKAE